MQKIISFRGVRLNQRTIDMILAAEKILGFQVRLTQGSYNAGGVAASAGTHDGGGAVDIAVKDAKTGELFPLIRRERMRDAFRQVGCAAWLRVPAQSRPPQWPYHLHVICIGDPDLSSGARSQVQDYKANRNGLVSGARDDGPRTWVNVTWESYKKAHPPVVIKPPAAKPTEVPLSASEVQDIKNYVNDRVTAHEKVMRANFARVLRYGIQTEDDRQKYNDKYDSVIAAGGTDAQAADAAWPILAPLDAALAQEQRDLS